MENVFVRTDARHTDLPVRSRLYRLAPLEVGTPMVESLTSYINRLAWAYRISPRILVAEEIIPNLSRAYYFQSSPVALSTYCRQLAIVINSFGEIAVDWSTTIEGLTQQIGLGRLTSANWACGIPSNNFLKTSAAWCPACYTEWEEKNLPVYQPLNWMLQVVTSCTRHRRKLEEQCNKCQKRQSVFPSKLQPGHCTQCGTWLGLSKEAAEEPRIEGEELAWQNWIAKTIEELRTVDGTSDTMSWKRISMNFAVCLEGKGAASRFAHLMGVSAKLISQWQHSKMTPSLQKVLEICYAAGISPLQLMGDPASMRNAIQAISEHPHRRPAHHRHPVVNRKEIREHLQAVLDGQRPNRGIHQLERELGISFGSIAKTFPIESSLVSKLYKAQRAQAWKQLIARACDEVRQVALVLHEQGVYPSSLRVGPLLTTPSAMRRPIVYGTWRAVLQELGFKK